MEQISETFKIQYRRALPAIKYYRSKGYTCIPTFWKRPNFIAIDFKNEKVIAVEVGIPTMGFNKWKNINWYDDIHLVIPDGRKPISIKEL